MTHTSDIRSAFLQARRALARDEAAAKSAAVRAALQALSEFQRADAYLCYVASTDNEVDTKPLIEGLLAEGKTVLVPIANADRTLSWSLLWSLSELAAGRFGILEPVPVFGRITQPPVHALVLVPGIAFSRKGHRIGYGGGYFDRFLQTHEGLKIGLAYDLQITDIIDPAPHDVPVDMVVTESQVYCCH